MQESSNERTISIVTEYVPGGENVEEEWSFRRRGNTGWEVNGPDDDPDEWHLYASSRASSRTVQQLLRKDHSALY